LKRLKQFNYSESGILSFGGYGKANLHFISSLFSGKEPDDFFYIFNRLIYK